LAIKEKTLVIEFSGANDLILVHKYQDVNEVIVGQTVDARITNLNALIKMEYKHFILFNLPDISLTPEVQNGDAKYIQRYSDMIQLFNNSLAEKVGKVAEDNPAVTILVYDLYKIFGGFYDEVNHNHFGFQANLAKTQLVNNEAYLKEVEKSKSDLITPQGKRTAIRAAAESYHQYLFWNTIHPTTHVHRYLASDFYRYCFSPNFNYIPISNVGPESAYESILAMVRDARDSVTMFFAGESVRWQEDFFQQVVRSYHPSDYDTSVLH